ncbi:ABC transporter ATP-binding protein [Oribacterium sp. WCC10]|uniref:ABC transporter ATP-binding protein n=1 Tax=Oribacterium sp. WCC10 TaxID=1855343 RepID=UPI0008EC765D|nr:ABC transporter ATP-binding protein [Oribacterium sp. WCC10]SFG06671.1 ATP-binding cassette, subfamily B [Oribacterium sp. WCC10]
MDKKKTLPSKTTIIRLIKLLFSFYPKLVPFTLVCILINAVVSAIPSMFQQKVIALIEQNWKDGDWSAVSGQILGLVSVLAVLYAISLLAGIVYNQCMAIITQGSLKKLRVKMFDGMQDLPIRYFDQHEHGDIMSYYTNDVDTLRQLISQSIPQLIVSAVTIVTIFALMMYYSIWLTIIVVGGLFVMTKVVKKVGGGSGRYFMKQQSAVAKTEGFIQEMMNGQKVVKVFNHEAAAEADFDKINDELFEVARTANRYANTLMPILGNIGNILYVVLAFAGGALLLLKVPNLSLSGMALSISITVPFLNMEKQFAGQIGGISQQINAVVMGLAGVNRIFSLMDEIPEEDDGEVTLVHAKEENGQIVESSERTEMWAWKHIKEDGTAEFRKLEGDVVLKDVDFSYDGKHTVLHEVNVFARPGQKVAFVGATGAGKTTITNLINRFYEIQDGTITYDGIDIKKIRKADLRHSLGIILQDTVLFTGTVMENIRYGKLDATDEECMAAARLAGADDFIRRLPEGYNTMLLSNGSNLSQGQRQLISIARAAVADPPVMIMDEATSSIDTHTEAIVQRGMDALMAGRTVFVIAHRLSTVQNSDVIMVLDHGRIIERGSHDELIAAKGNYYQLYTGAFELE